MQGLKKLLLKEQKNLEMICSKVENELKDNEGTYISKIDSELPNLL